MQQGAFLFFLASRAKERYHDHGATSREGVGMDLSEIVVKTLNDKQLSEALANCLEKLKGHGPAFPEDISGLLRALGTRSRNTQHRSAHLESEHRLEEGLHHKGTALSWLRER